MPSADTLTELPKFGLKYLSYARPILAPSWFLGGMLFILVKVLLLVVFPDVFEIKIFPEIVPGITMATKLVSVLEIFIAETPPIFMVSIAFK